MLLRTNRVGEAVGGVIIGLMFLEKDVRSPDGKWNELDADSRRLLRMAMLAAFNHVSGHHETWESWSRQDRRAFAVRQSQFAKWDEVFNATLTELSQSAEFVNTPAVKMQPDKIKMFIIRQHGMKEVIRSYPDAWTVEADNPSPMDVSADRLAQDAIDGLLRAFDIGQLAESVQFQVGAQTGAEGLVYYPTYDSCRLQCGDAGEGNHVTDMMVGTMADYARSPSKPQYFRHVVLREASAYQLAGPTFYHSDTFRGDTDGGGGDDATILQSTTTVVFSTAYNTLAHTINAHLDAPLKRAELARRMLMGEPITAPHREQAHAAVKDFKALLGGLSHGGPDGGVRLESIVYFDVPAWRTAFDEGRGNARDLRYYMALAVGKVMASHWSQLKPSALSQWTVCVVSSHLHGAMTGVIDMLWRALGVLVERHPEDSPTWTIEDHQAFLYIWGKIQRVATMARPKDYYSDEMDQAARGWAGLPVDHFQLDPTQPDTFMGLVRPFNKVIRNMPATEQSYRACIRYHVATTNGVQRQYRDAVMYGLSLAFLRSQWISPDFHHDDLRAVRLLLQRLCMSVIKALISDAVDRLDKARRIPKAVKDIIPKIQEDVWNHRQAFEQTSLLPKQEQVHIVGYRQPRDFFRCALLNHQHGDHTLQLSDLFHFHQVSNSFVTQQYGKPSPLWRTIRTLQTMNQIMKGAPTRSPLLTVAIVCECFDKAVDAVVRAHHMEVFPNVLPPANWRHVPRHYVVFPIASRTAEVEMIHTNHKVLQSLMKAREYLQRMADFASKEAPLRGDSEDEKKAASSHAALVHGLHHLAQPSTFDWDSALHRTIVWAVLFRPQRVSQGRVNWLNLDVEAGGILLADFLSFVLLNHEYGPHAQGDIRCDAAALDALGSVRVRLRHKVGKTKRLKRMFQPREQMPTFGERYMTGLLEVDLSIVAGLSLDELLTMSSHHSTAASQGLVYAPERVISAEGLEALKRECFEPEPEVAAAVEGEVKADEPASELKEKDVDPVDDIAPFDEQALDAGVSIHRFNAHGVISVQHNNPAGRRVRRPDEEEDQLEELDLTDEAQSAEEDEAAHQDEVAEGKEGEVGEGGGEEAGGRGG